jgi:hypothetical protein
MSFIFGFHVIFRSNFNGFSFDQVSGVRCQKRLKSEILSFGAWSLGFNCSNLPPFLGLLLAPDSWLLNLYLSW